MIVVSDYYVSRLPQPPLSGLTAEVSEKAYLQPITHYLSARAAEQNRLAESIATLPILHLCRTAIGLYYSFVVVEAPIVIDLR